MRFDCMQLMLNESLIIKKNIGKVAENLQTKTNQEASI